MVNGSYTQCQFLNLAGIKCSGNIIIKCFGLQLTRVVGGIMKRIFLIGQFSHLRTVVNEVTII